MINPAPVRVPRQSTLNSPLVKAANKIVTSPTFNKVKSIDFDKKHEYDKFIKFIESSNKELLKINLPKSKDIKSDDDGGGGGGGLGLLASLLLTPIAGKLALTAMKLVRLLKGLKNLIPRGLRLRLKRWWRNRTMRFRRLGRFFRQLPGKIINWGRKKFNQVKTFIRKNFDEAILGIKNFLKNLKNSKFVKNILSKANKLKTIADDAVKVGKEVVTNSKVVKASTNIIQKVTKKAGPKLASLTAGELTVIGGIAVDLSMAAYRFKKGDVTGGVLSTLSAIPILGIPVAAVDIARDFNVFDDDSTILGKIDFLNVLKSKKQKDKEKNESEETEVNSTPKNSLESLENVSKPDPKLIQKQKETEERLQDDTTTKDKKVTPSVDVKVIDEEKNLYRIPEGGEGPLIPITTVIDNRQTFLVPFDAGAQETSNGGSSGGAVNLSVTPSIIVMNPNSLLMDELLQLKLDKE